MNLTLSQLFLGALLILLGITWMGWVTIAPLFIGIMAFVTGILVLIDGVHPVVVVKRA